MGFINNVTESLLKEKGIDKSNCEGRQCSNWQADICGTENCGIYSLQKGEEHTTFTQEFDDGSPSSLMAVDTQYIKNDKDEVIGHVEVVTDIEDSKIVSALTDFVSKSLVETSSSLEEVSKTVDNNLEDAEHANEVSNEITKISKLGDASIEHLVESMEEIKKSNEKIQEVVEIIQEIEEKTKAIDEIVFQTKLLSFNASVEAERAGEHGRGFSVVAQEVGNLAQLSGKSASGINEILGESIKRVKSISHDNSVKVDEGTSSVIESAKILKEINKKSHEINEITRKVFESSREQRESIRIVTTAVSELDRETNSSLSSLRFG